MTSFDKPLNATIAGTKIAARETKTIREVDAAKITCKIAALETELQGHDYYLANADQPFATARGVEMATAGKANAEAKLAALKAQI